MVNLSMENIEPNIVVGIDEVGRGAISGPITVGLAACCETSQHLLKSINVKDSKKLSQKQREEINYILHEPDSLLIYKDVVHRSASCIDRYGIKEATQQCVKQLLLNLLNAKQNRIKSIHFDKGLKPDYYGFPIPKAISITEDIKAENKYLVVAAASIVAKVARDNLMIDLSRYCEGYGFESHKGYGTKEHYEALKTLGFIPNVHRVEYLR